MRKLGLFLVLFISLIFIGGVVYSAQEYWCRYLPNGGFCANWNTTESSYIWTGVKTNWSDILNPPPALGGGTTIPITNVTNLIGSKQCSSTDKVKNITINNTGLYVTCDTDQTGGAGSGNINVTNPSLIIANANIMNFTKNFTATNPSGSQALINVNSTNVQLRIANSCSAGNYIKSVDENGTATCQADANSGGTVTQINAGWGLNDTTITGTGTLYVNKTMIDLYYFTKSSGIQSLTLGTNYTFPGVTGLVLGTNYSFPGVTGLTLGTNYSFPGVTGLVLGTNYSFPGVTGLTLGTNYSFPGVTNLVMGTNYTFGGVTGLTVGTNYTAFSAGNLTNATSFPTSNFTMPGNLTVNTITISCAGTTSCNMSRTSTNQWIVWNSTGIYISGG